MLNFLESKSVSLELSSIHLKIIITILILSRYNSSGTWSYKEKLHFISGRLENANKGGKNANEGPCSIANLKDKKLSKLNQS